MNNNIFKISLFIYLIISGIIFSFFIPPFTKPDEPIHFSKTLEVKENKIICKNNEEYYNKIDYYKVIHELSNKYRLAGNPVYIFPLSEYKKISIFINKNQFKEKKLKTNFCHLNSLPYIIPALIIKIGEYFSFNPYINYFLGRFINYLFLVTILFLIIIKTKNENIKKILTFCLLIPVSIQQLTGYSYDSLTIFFSLISFYFLFNYQENNKIKDLFLFGFFLILTIISKNFFYFPLILIFIFKLTSLTNKKINKSKKYIFYLITTIIILLFSLILIKLIKNSKIINTITNKEFYFSSLIDPQIQFNLILNYPKYFIEVFINNLSIKQHFFIESIFINLEWLQFSLSPIILYILIVLFSIITIKTKIKIDNLTIFNIFISIFLFIFLIFFYLYLIWTKLGHNQIEGFQGRYLIPIMPFIIIILNRIINFLSNKKIILPTLMIFLLFLISFDIYKRHYDYSKIINKKEAKISNKKINIKENMIFKINVEKNKKINGIYFYYDDKKPNPPFVLNFFEENCQKKINYQVIPTDSLLKRNRNIIFIKTIKTNNKDRICLKLDTLSIKNFSLKINSIIIDKKEYFFSPIYSF